MRLLLIRHGETVHNVAGVYAGITDSALTNHGVLQANRLAIHLLEIGVKIAHIFSSDLQRAVKTAEAVRDAQSPPPETTKLELLREQDFGFYEMKQFSKRPRDSSGNTHLEAHRNDPGYRDVESKESMRLRIGTFINTHLARLLHEVEDGHTVVVVAHGIILSHLWKVILKRFSPENVSIAPGVQAAEKGFSLEYLGGWSNTGYMDLEIKRKNGAALESMSAEPSSSKPASSVLKATEESSPAALEFPQQPVDLSPNTPSALASPTLLHLSLVVKAVNSQEHLKGLKKTRGGIGSLKHDSSQKTMDSFYKKRRIE